MTGEDLKDMNRVTKDAALPIPGKLSNGAIIGAATDNDGNVIEVDYNLYVRPGPRVVKGILDLHNKLYSGTAIPESEVFSK